ncbi:hypothetical protein E6H18_08700 [Candidatus Bathyarchaeota archaeon]|nr:MAG: hypothetical protein E6H18_08700 [Candidatus Bathyarchaeota archaeon]
MKFLKVEWTKKRGAIALLATSLAVTSFILGGYVATGNLNPWGNRHYYQVLNANFRACYTPAGGTPECQSSHNVMFNTGAQYVEKLVTSNNEGFCAVSASCSFHFIAMSGNTAAPSAGQSSTGVNGASSSGDCGNAGGTGGQNGSELTTNGFTAVAGDTVTDISGNSPQSSTVVKTFTDATAATTVAQSCLVNQAGNNSANRVDLAAATFSAITLQIGDTIQITWTITWTWT